MIKYLWIAGAAGLVLATAAAVPSAAMAQSTCAPRHAYPPHACADEAFGYYTEDGTWVPGPVTGHYDSEGVWIAGDPDRVVVDDHRGYWVGVDTDSLTREDQLGRRIRAAMARGDLRAGDADRALDTLDGIRRDDRAARESGYSRDDADGIQARLDDLAASVRVDETPY
jgi:hypothetical protein